MGIDGCSRPEVTECGWQTAGLIERPRGLCASWDLSRVFTARCYASALLAVGLCLSVSVRLSPKSVFYRNG